MPAAATPLETGWTCPFCGLLCDEFALEAGNGVPRLLGSDCSRARAGLEAHGHGVVATASIDGAAASTAQAIAAAAQRLAGWRQPLFGGLGMDVVGARSLYRLAARTGAICDHADGGALMHGLRALQDRGQFTATLAEVRARADLIVCVGTQAVPNYPEFFRRCGLADPSVAPRQLVFFDAAVPDGLPAGVEAQAVRGSGGLFDDLQQLAALVAGQRLSKPEEPLVDLAQRLRSARYAVLVWEPGALPAHGALWAESLQRLVESLNRVTRAATLALGGSDGATSVNQVFTWLSGLPLRSRAGAAGIEHEPLRFDAARLVADGAVDGVLWIASFDPRRVPPSLGRAGLPHVVLGPPAMAARLDGVAGAQDCVFLPVATPGLNAPGHLFRTDGIVVVPLVAVRDDGLDGVASVLARIGAQLEAAS